MTREISELQVPLELPVLEFRVPQDHRVLLELLELPALLVPDFRALRDRGVLLELRVLLGPPVLVLRGLQGLLQKRGNVE